MRGLSAQQQKIVQYLSMVRVPRTVQDIARGCLATSNTVSRQLKTLLDRKFVARIPQGRETYYEMAETLFRICYEADLDHKGAPVRLFVDFLGNYYTAKELEVRARGFGLLANLRRPETAHLRDEAMLHVAALRRYFGQEFALPEERAEGDHWDSFFTDLQKIKAYKEIISFAKLLGDDKTSDVVLVESEAHFARGNINEACAVLRNEILRSPRNPALHAMLGVVLARSGALQDADASLQESLRLQPSDTVERWLWYLPTAEDVEGEAAQLKQLVGSG